MLAMLPEDWKFIRAFREVLDGYIGGTIRSEHIAITRFKELAPGHQDKDYRQAFNAIIEIAKLARKTISDFFKSQPTECRDWDYSKIDYEGCMEEMDKVIPNYERNLKMGAINYTLQLALR